MCELFYQKYCTLNHKKKYIFSRFIYEKCVYLPKNNRYETIMECLHLRGGEDLKRNIARLEGVEGEPIPQAACITGRICKEINCLSSLKVF
jgi:hypothetical protein